MPDEIGPNSTEEEKALEYYRVKPNESKIQSDSAAERFIRRMWSLSGAADPSGAVLAPMPLDFSLQEPANSFIAKIVNRIINSRNEVYHATTPAGAAAILDTGEIKPGMFTYPAGVSVSRVPNILAQQKDVRLVLDQSKLPKNNPLAEFGWNKTRSDYEYKIPRPEMNPAFEFENRTKNEPIPVEAIKKVLLKQAPKSSADGLENLLLENRIHLDNIPTETFGSERELNTLRARRAWDDYYKLKDPKQEFFMNLFRRSAGSEVAK